MATVSEPHENRSQNPTAGAPRFSDAPLAYVVSAVLLGSAFVALLWVPSYAHVKPTLGGFPFFYWYSLMWLLINAACQWIAYWLLVVAPRRRREGNAR